MITRVRDPEVLQDALKLYPFDDIKLDASDWLETRGNVAYEEDGNVGMFDLYFPGVYSGHYFFRDRGKKAKELSIRILRHVFDYHKATAIRGLTPIKHKAAIWMTRNIGFKDYGEVETEIGPCVIFVMTRDEFTALYGDSE